MNIVIPVATKPSRRILRRAESAPGPRDDDEGVDISYVGGNIPSRSFKMLQQSVGEPTDYGRHTHTYPQRLKSANGRDVTKRAILDVNYIVSEQSYDILTPSISPLLTLRSLPDLRRPNQSSACVFMLDA